MACKIKKATVNSTIRDVVAVWVAMEAIVHPVDSLCRYFIAKYARLVVLVLKLTRNIWMARSIRKENRLAS